MLSDPAPRPARCYDPATPPHRDEQGVHIYDHATIRGLLRDPQRATSDVSELITPEQRDHLHPVSSFVWATDRTTLSGCPGRHAALRSAMAPWFAPGTAARRTGTAEGIASGIADGATPGAFDAHQDYALPVAESCLADWLGITTADVRYAVDDQLAVDDMFADSAAGDSRDGRVLPRRDGPARPVRRGRAGPRDGGGRRAHRAGVVGRALRDLRRRRGDREDGHARRRPEPRARPWPAPADRDQARTAVEEALRLGTPFPQATRTARESFTVGDVTVQPGEQVLMWLTAAKRGLPGEHRAPLDGFGPDRDSAQHPGWGSGYHRCGGLHHARTAAVAAVVTLARRCPDLAMDGSWKRDVGVDDGYVAAPVITLPDRSPPVPR